MPKWSERCLCKTTTGVVAVEIIKPQGTISGFKVVEGSHWRAKRAIRSKVKSSVKEKV